ncbi:MAG: adenylate/guanylate cyclase domain-containing protein [Pseudomonadales bacterium]|nr:adenylate/guanylate cyclase domain-containing protein [Pseudomonadales bacterium]
MDDSIQHNLAILFADVAGSTQLYDTLGDICAESQISGCLSTMIAVVNDNNGHIVKNIGDEILCHFPSANLAASAACTIHETLADERSDLKVKIGINFGPAILKQGDVFGDTVNVAARMVGLAKQEQIIVTGSFYDSLINPDNFNQRKLDSLKVKGKDHPVDIHEILWKGDDTELTCFLSAKSILETKQEWSAQLKYHDTECLINRTHPTVSLGRDCQCDAVIHSQKASRQHAVIISRWGKAVLQDKSTNGTFVTLNTNSSAVYGETSDEIFVHMEEFALPETGIISLGAPAKDNPNDLIYFKYL